MNLLAIPKVLTKTFGTPSQVSPPSFAWRTIMSSLPTSVFCKCDVDVGLGMGTVHRCRSIGKRFRNATIESGNRTVGSFIESTTTGKPGTGVGHDTEFEPELHELYLCNLALVLLRGFHLVPIQFSLISQSCSVF